MPTKKSKQSKQSTANIKPKKPDYLIGYMCKTDYDYELGHALGGSRIFPDAHDCLQEMECIKARKYNCGMVRVKVYLDEVLIEGDN